MSTTTRTWTAEFRTSPARHGAGDRAALAHMDGQRVTVLGTHWPLLGQSDVRDSAGRLFTVLDSELFNHRQQVR